ncbi:hypothetical protein GGR57DRAFT_487533 [Xylariaceae sp. FL1272]|nr:hypothetical protein GGR57DRAFT_487533 [Xylariaceae sp. FL1272]
MTQGASISEEGPRPVPQIRIHPAPSSTSSASSSSAQHATMAASLLVPPKPRHAPDTRNLDLPQQSGYLFGMKVAGRLRKRFKDPYLDEDAMEKLGVSCQYMDFDPEPSAQDPDALLALMPAQKMQILAKEYHFSRFHDLDYSDESNMSATSRIANRLHSYLFSTPEPDTLRPDFLIKQTIWDLRGLSDFEEPAAKVFRDDIKRYWLPSFVLYDRNGTNPHLKTYLEESADLREDGLMPSELWTILVLACSAFNQPEWRNFEIIPVTVISGSGRSVRVVQGWADGKKKVVNIRKTRLVHFGDGLARDKDPAHVPKFLTLMRWLMAEPIPGRPA